MIKVSRICSTKQQTEEEMIAIIEFVDNHPKGNNWTRVDETLDEWKKHFHQFGTLLPTPVPGPEFSAYQFFKLVVTEGDDQIYAVDVLPSIPSC